MSASGSSSVAAAAVASLTVMVGVAVHSGRLHELTLLRMRLKNNSKKTQVSNNGLDRVSMSIRVVQTSLVCGEQKRGLSSRVPGLINST